MCSMATLFGRIESKWPIHRRINNIPSAVLADFRYRRLLLLNFSFFIHPKSYLFHWIFSLTFQLLLRCMGFVFFFSSLSNIVTDTHSNWSLARLFRLYTPTSRRSLSWGLRETIWRSVRDAPSARSSFAINKIKFINAFICWYLNDMRRVIIHTNAGIHSYMRRISLTTTDYRQNVCSFAARAFASYRRTMNE